MRLTEAQKANVTKWATVINFHYPESWNHLKFNVKKIFYALSKKLQSYYGYRLGFDV